MKKFFILITLFIGLYINSCRTDRVNDYETEVLDEIFDDLIEKLSVFLTYYEGFQGKRRFGDETDRLLPGLQRHLSVVPLDRRKEQGYLPRFL